MTNARQRSIVHEIVDGRLEITRKTSASGTLTTIAAHRMVAILAVALIIVVVIMAR
jgi:hypothetical protein